MDQYSGKGVWCVAELRHGSLVPTLYELQSAGQLLAQQLNEPLCAIFLGGPGKASAAAQEAAQRGGWDKVLYYENPVLENFFEDIYSLALKAAIDKERPNKILFSSSVFGKSLSSRLASVCRAGLASDATQLGLDGENHLLATRSAYGGSLQVVAGLRKGPEMVTLRPLAYHRAAPVAGAQGTAVELSLNASGWEPRAKYLGFSPEESKEIELSSAEKIVSGGQGLGEAKGFEIVRELANVLGAAVGASRQAVDKGWIPYRHQVGLTGRTVRPKLYFACGISGQIQHLAGMSASEVVVAVNTDKDCPMMKLATFAVQGDLYKIIPAVISEIKKQRGG